VEARATRPGALESPGSHLSALGPTKRRAYLERRCSDCKRRQLTGVTKGTYTCNACRQALLARGQDGSRSRTSEVPDVHHRARAVI